MRLVFDIETNGLLPDVSKIHTICTLDLDTDAECRYHDDESVQPRAGSMKDGLAQLAKATLLVGQNLIRYDVPVVQLVTKLDLHSKELFDTHTASSVIWPNIADADFTMLRQGRLPEEFKRAGLIGTHKLEAWGWRLGAAKGDFDPANYKQDDGEPHTWATIPFSQDMSDYCAQDCRVTKALYLKILSKNYSQECLDLEHAVARVIAKQERRGFAFDEPRAQALYAKLQGERVEMEAGLCDLFHPWWTADRKKGSAEFTPRGVNNRLGYVKGATFSRVKQLVFNPGSRDHIADRLTAIHGWMPEEFTDGGKPKVDEAVLGSLPYAEAKTLARYMTIQKKLGQIGDGENSWFRFTRNGRIHGSVRTNGAVTGRMAHFKPNVGQVDKDPEMRACWTAGAGYVLVGCDADGLELRMLGHYMAKYDGGAYAQSIVHGKKEDGTDAHSLNQKAAGLRLRDSAKIFVYALLYGAGNYKLGTIAYDDFEDERKARFDVKFTTHEARRRALARIGKERRDNLMRGLPAFQRLIDDVKVAAKARGFLRGLDGRLLHIRSDHAALNTLLQSAGAIVMKRALVILAHSLRERNYSDDDVGFVANVHDEFQMEARSVIANEVGALAADSIRLAGESFGLRIPLAGNFDVGATWAETH
jgi:DNA polymerase I-like protein with 3'-5' exonuclease and polymerase domains